jgi:imidazolonepropionase-like amidohydrolase
MRRLPAFAAVLALLAAGHAAAEVVAVTNARLPGAASAPDAAAVTIVVDGGKIRSVRPGAAPAGARILDAGGRLVTPGLMNGGTHLGLVEVDAAKETSDEEARRAPLGAAFDVEYAVNANSTLLPLARADGLTRAATYPSGADNIPFSGQAAVLRLSEGAQIVDRPRAAMVAEVGGFSTARGGGSRAAQWLLLRNALAEAKRYRTPLPAAPPAATRDQLLNHLDAEAMQPVLTGRMPLVVRASRESDIREAIRIGADFGVRVVVLGGAEAWRLAPQLAAAKVAVVLDPFDVLPFTFDELGARLDNAAILDRAGVPIAFSVSGIHLSHNAGSALREAAGLAVANGLPWDRALRAVTAGPAEIWGIADHYGALRPGMDADLVVWDGDPLEPMSRPTAVLVQGKAVSLHTRQSALAARYSPARRSDPWPAPYH